MPAPAGTGLSRRSFLLRSAGLALSVYGAGRLAPLRAEDGARAGRRRRAGDRAGVPRRRDRLGLVPRPDRGPDVHAPAPEARAAAGHRARRSARTRGCAGTRRRRRSPALHAEGKVSVMPAVGYEHPDQSHFVSRHFYEVGALDPRLGDRLARPLPRPRRLARQPAAGARARLVARARARRRRACRSPPSTRRRTTTSGPATCGATSTS